MHFSAASSAFKFNMERNKQGLSPYPAGLGGVTIVGHGGEPNYARRLATRLGNEVTSQFGPHGQGWAAFYWTNGAPIAGVLKELKQRGVPHGLRGIILLGDAVAFPSPSIESFVFIVSAETFGADPTDRLSVQSETDNEYAANVLKRFEVSSGVRATRLCAIKGDERLELLRRDGRRRVLPFNLLIDPDPAVDQKNAGREAGQAIIGDDQDFDASVVRSILGPPT